jgi:hypothetical protein
VSVSVRVGKLVASATFHLFCAPRGFRMGYPPLGDVAIFIVPSSHYRNVGNWHHLEDVTALMWILM